jgi:hypothetical protein
MFHSGLMPRSPRLQPASASARALARSALEQHPRLLALPKAQSHHTHALWTTETSVVAKKYRLVQAFVRHTWQGSEKWCLQGYLPALEDYVLGGCVEWNFSWGERWDLHFRSIELALPFAQAASSTSSIALTVLSDISFPFSFHQSVGVGGLWMPTSLLSSLRKRDKKKNRNGERIGYIVILIGW